MNHARLPRNDLAIGLSPAEFSQVCFQIAFTSDRAGVGGFRSKTPDLLAKRPGLHLVKFDQAREFRLHPRFQLPDVELDCVSNGLAEPLPDDTLGCPDGKRRGDPGPPWA